MDKENTDGMMEADTKGSGNTVFRMGRVNTQEKLGRAMMASGSKENITEEENSFYPTKIITWGTSSTENIMDKVCFMSMKLEKVLMEGSNLV